MLLLCQTIISTDIQGISRDKMEQSDWHALAGVHPCGQVVESSSTMACPSPAPPTKGRKRVSNARLR